MSAKKKCLFPKYQPKSTFLRHYDTIYGFWICFVVVSYFLEPKHIKAIKKKKTKQYLGSYYKRKYIRNKPKKNGKIFQRICRFIHEKSHV